MAFKHLDFYLSRVMIDNWLGLGLGGSRAGVDKASWTGMRWDGMGRTLSRCESAAMWLRAQPILSGDCLHTRD